MINKSNSALTAASLGISVLLTDNGPATRGRSRSGYRMSRCRYVSSEQFHRMRTVNSEEATLPETRGRSANVGGTARAKQAPYELLKQAILGGDLQPGQPLIETVLAERYEVSRTPIREALTRLEQDGVVVRSDRGLIVRMRSPEEILDIYETRILLEGRAARIAAERHSRVDVLTLRRLADEMSGVDTADERAMVIANREFHQALWWATHNEAMIDLLTRLDLHLIRYPATTLTQPGRWQEANAEHRLIVDAIERSDTLAAEAIATQHFTEARDIRLTLWGQRVV
jgi:DNA-binding GntR family transcriptional regulator